MAYTPTYAPKPTGLISQPAYDVATQEMTPAQTMAPSTRAVDPNELSQVQLQKILSSGSPLMQHAASQGKALANQRGLLNSSLAAQSAQNAVIEAATPFATQDANTTSNVLSANQQAQQQANQLNAQQNFQQQATNTAAVNRAQELAAGNKFDLEKLNTEYGLRNAQLQLQNEIATEQSQLAQGNELQKAYVTNSNTLMNNYLNGWFKIQESEMTPAEKTTALSEYNATIRTWQTVLNTAYASLPQWQDEWGMTFQ